MNSGSKKIYKAVPKKLFSMNLPRKDLNKGDHNQGKCPFVRKLGTKTKIYNEINNELVTGQMAFCHCLFKGCSEGSGGLG